MRQPLMKLKCRLNAAAASVTCTIERYCCTSSEALLFTIYQLFITVIDHWFNKQSPINRGSFNIPRDDLSRLSQ